jgi:putative membrane protein
MEPEHPEDDLLLDRNIMAKLRTTLASERTLLAAERTLSAWIRTGLAGLGGGLMLAHFLVFENFYHSVVAKIVGHLLIIWGIFIFIFALFGYNRVRKMVEITLGYKIPLWNYSFVIITILLISIILLSITFLPF